MIPTLGPALGLIPLISTVGAKKKKKTPGPSAHQLFFSFRRKKIQGRETKKKKKKSKKTFDPHTHCRRERDAGWG